MLLNTDRNNINSVDLLYSFIRYIRTTAQIQKAQGIAVFRHGYETFVRDLFVAFKIENLEMAELFDENLYAAFWYDWAVGEVGVLDAALVQRQRLHGAGGEPRAARQLQNLQVGAVQDHRLQALSRQCLALAQVQVGQVHVVPEYGYNFTVVQRRAFAQVYHSQLCTRVEDLEIRIG